jgi:hypothetical protein
MIEKPAGIKKVHGVVLGLTPQPVKSSHSAGYSNCVMVGSSRPDVVEVTDSKLDVSPELTVSPAAWLQMIREVQSGL